MTSDTTYDQLPSAVVENVPIHSDLSYVEILDPESTESLDGEYGSVGICIKCFLGRPTARCFTKGGNDSVSHLLHLTAVYPVQST